MGYDWPVITWIVVVHLGALAAPFFFTWKALGLCAFLAWLTGSIGVCMGYHRQLTHGSFSTYRPMRWLLAFFGGLSGEGSALTWVANHRKHHLYSDHEGDPHSPRDGRWWSHMLWFMPDFGRKHYETLFDRFAPDLAKDRMMRFLHLFFLPSHIILGTILFAIGYFGWDTHTGWSFVVWGMFVRLVYVLHVTWFVNSASAHLGLPQLRNQRRQPQPVVGRPAGLRRGLAQQPPRLSTDGPPGAQVVGNRRDLLVDLADGKSRPGLERRQGSAQAHQAGLEGHVSS